MLNIIRNWVIKTMMKSKGETGIVKTIPKRDLVELNTQITAQRLMENGIDPNSLKNTDQVENAIIAIENRNQTMSIGEARGSGIRSTREAKVFDMEGKEIPKGSQIMGGKEVENTTGSLMSVPNKKGLAGMEYETDAAIKTRLEKGNKETTQRIKNRKMVKDAIDNASPGFVRGDRKYNAQLVAEDLAEKKFGKEYYDLDQTQQLDLYDEALEGYDELTRGMPDPEDFAQGGRAGFKSGSFLFEGAKKLGKKYKGSTLESLLENPKLLGTELSYEGIMEMLRMSGMMQDGGRAGFFLGSANPKGLGLLRQVLNYMSKTGKEQGKFKGADLSGLDMLRLSNPKAFNKMLEDVRGKVNIREGIMGTDTVRAQQQALREKRKGLTEKSLDVAKAMKRDEDRIAKKIAEESERTIIPRTKIMMMEGMGMSEEAAEKAARDMAEAAQNMRPLNAPPKITDEGILQLENVLKNMETGGKKKRDLNATGGRIGFKDGPKKSMTRRTFLKLLGGLATIPIIGKIVKPIKLAKGVKNVPIIKTDNVAGKPEWFDALVNKVIIEGDDVTKKFATGERQSIHQKTLDDGSVVRVTEDVDDGAVRVEYDSDANVYGDPVQMQYKKPLPDEGAPNPAAEFNTAESGPVGRADGPDDYSIDIDEVGGTSISDLTSDVSKLKEYATGKKPTMKEFIQNKKRKDRAKGISEGGENEMDEVIRRQGEFIEADLVDLDSPEFASGGIARMLGE